MATTAALLTFEEFERLPEDPDNPGKVELFDGEIVQMPPVELPHTTVALRLFKNFLRHFDAAGTPPALGEVYFETGFMLGTRHWLIPDISIEHAGQARGRYLQGAPALAIEVISPSNSAAYIHRKVKRYFAGGAIEVWVVFPDTASVMVHRPGIAREFTTSLESELLPGWSLDLAKLFT